VLGQVMQPVSQLWKIHLALISSQTREESGNRNSARKDRIPRSPPANSTMSSCKPRLRSRVQRRT
jgi:hypothetical protein